MDDKQLITINYKIPNSTTCQTSNTNCPMLDIIDIAHPTCLLFERSILPLGLGGITSDETGPFFSPSSGIYTLHGAFL